MSDPWGPPWSNRSNAPQIPYRVYLAEKEAFVGNLAVGAVSYGIVVALFFQCMAALLSPANPMRRVIRGALVVHTVALFVFVSIPVGMGLNFSSIEYINDREFPGNDQYPPGPLGYDGIVSTKATAPIFNAMFPLNQWLADGLLLHRCYLIYAMNHWAMAFPCLMYFASVALGIANIYWESEPGSYPLTAIKVTTSYYSTCLSLNVLLTLMIVIRLIVHVRNIRKLTGDSDGSSSGFHTAAATVATMLVESYAIYAAALLAYIVPWAIQSWVLAIFSTVIGTAQVIAPYLVILRVAKRRALTNRSVSGTVEFIRFKSQGSTDYGDESLPDGDPTDAAEVNGETSGEVVAREESVIEEVPS